MIQLIFWILLSSLLSCQAEQFNGTVLNVPTANSNPIQPVSCSCGVFLSGSFKKFSTDEPTENPIIVYDHPEYFPCSSAGKKRCTTKCLDAIIKYLPNSSSNLCMSIDRNCFKERAYLFIKNCKDKWINTNLSSGREYCCKDHHYFKCPRKKV